MLRSGAEEAELSGPLAKPESEILHLSGRGAETLLGKPVLFVICAITALFDGSHLDRTASSDENWFDRCGED